MSAESASALADRIKSDDAFRTQLEGAADPTARAQIIVDEGFTIEKDDVAHLQSALAEDGPMSDAELEGVAGGGASDGGTINIGNSAVCINASPFNW